MNNTLRKLLFASFAVLLALGARIQRLSRNPPAASAAR